MLWVRNGVMFHILVPWKVCNGAAFCFLNVVNIYASVFHRHISFHLVSTHAPHLIFHRHVICHDVSTQVPHLIFHDGNEYGMK